MSQQTELSQEYGYVSPVKPTNIQQPQYPGIQETIQRVRLTEDTEFPTIYRPKRGAPNSTGYEAVVSLYNQNEEVMKFRVFKDTELGINVQAQKYLHNVKNDDDRQTTNTQLDRALAHTLHDLKKGVHYNNPSYQLSQPSSQHQATQSVEQLSTCASSQLWQQWSQNL